MKALFVMFALLLTSNSSFAVEQRSEFERGYEAGRSSCNSVNELWVCTAECYYDDGGYKNRSQSGKSRSEALSNLRNNTRPGAGYTGSVSCSGAVDAGRATCKKI